MLKLSPNFYITSIDSQNRWNNSKLEQEYKYNFRYKEFQVELTTMFTIIGHTQKDNIAIINFGYSVGIERWSDKAQRFSYIDDIRVKKLSSTNNINIMFKISLKNNIDFREKEFMEYVTTYTA